MLYFGNEHAKVYFKQAKTSSMKKEDLKKMTGKQLYDFYYNGYGNDILFSTVEDMYLSMREKVYPFLERVHREDKKLIAVYSGEKPPLNSDFVCEITDGALYINL